MASLQVVSAGPAAARAAAASSRSASATGRVSVRSVPMMTPNRTLTSSRRSVAMNAGSGIENMPGFGGGLGGGIKIGKGAKFIKPEDVVIESEAGMDYEPLRAALEAGEFQEADDITRAMLIQLAGEGARERGWVYFTEVKTIGLKDMKTMDDLWKAYSEGKFGFSVQKSLFKQCKSRWPQFFKRINWVQGENNIYRKWPQEFIYTKEAEKGHLPLTNALRGTELFTAIFNHPAFEEDEKKTKINASAGFDSKNL